MIGGPAVDGFADARAGRIGQKTEQRDCGVFRGVQSRENLLGRLATGVHSVVGEEVSALLVIRGKARALVGREFREADEFEVTAGVGVLRGPRAETTIVVVHEPRRMSGHTLAT